jgi:thymidine kinase
MSQVVISPMLHKGKSSDLTKNQFDYKVKQQKTSIFNATKSTF